MAALRPIVREPQNSSADREALALLRLNAGAQYATGDRAGPLRSLGGSYAGTKVGSKLNIRGGAL